MVKIDNETLTVKDLEDLGADDLDDVFEYLYELESSVFWK